MLLPRAHHEGAVYGPAPIVGILRGVPPPIAALIESPYPPSTRSNTFNPLWWSNPEPFERRSGENIIESCRTVFGARRLIGGAQERDPTRA